MGFIVKNIVLLGLTKASYVGCSLYDNFNVIYKSEDSSNMNVEKCAMSCSTFPLVILQVGKVM